MNARQRLEELLATRATEGLSKAKVAELEPLMTSYPEYKAESFELAAAAIDLALTRKLEPMPVDLRGKVLDRARSEGLLSPVTERPLAPVADLQAERFSRREAVAPAPPSRLPWLAAAAALIVAVAGWWPRLQPQADVPVVSEATIESAADAPDALRLAWAGTEDPAVGEAGGEVVWSGAEQRGFMRIRGLEVNDPAEIQYQLWIFDRAGDERYPVDGGVFDIPAGGGEALVPIDAKIAVDEPYLFAVTVEKPGGVVVSSRERIVLLAQV